MASKKHFSTGFSLVEVLVSVVVLGVGLLGAMGLLLASARTSNEAATFAAAVNLVRDLSEKTRMNHAIAQRNDASNGYLVEEWTEGPAPGRTGPSCIASSQPCDAAQLAAWDRHEWQLRVASALPDARASVCFDESPSSDAAGAYAWGCSHTGRSLVVKLGWLPPGAGGAGKADPPPRLVMQLAPGQPQDGRHGS